MGAPLKVPLPFSSTIIMIAPNAGTAPNIDTVTPRRKILMKFFTLSPPMIHGPCAFRNQAFNQKLTGFLRGQYNPMELSFGCRPNGEQVCGEHMLAHGLALHRHQRHGPILRASISGSRTGD